MVRARFPSSRHHRTPSTEPHGPDQRPASYVCRPVCAALAGPHLPCHALFACLCLDPCLLPLLYLPLCHHPTMCTRTISFSVFCKECPAGSHTTRTALRSPCIVCIQSILCFTSIHSKEPETALCSPATSFLHKDQFKWPVGWRMACRVRVSCLQRLKTEIKEKVQ